MSPPLKLACIGALALVSGTVSCDAGSRVAADAAYAIQLASGDGQRAAAGAEFALPLRVRVLDGDGMPARGVRVRFVAAASAQEYGRLLDTVALSGGDGIAGVRAVAGVVGKTLVVDASIPFVPGARGVRFSALAVAGPSAKSISPSSLKAGDTVVIAGSGLGGTSAKVRFGDAIAAALPGSTDLLVRAVAPACLTSGPVPVSVDVAGARSNTIEGVYASGRTTLSLQPFQYTTIAASQLANCIELSGGGTYLVAAQFASAPPGPPAVEVWRLGVETNGASVQSAGADRLSAEPVDPPGARLRMEAHARALERDVASQLRTERASATLAAARDPVLPALGTIRSFSVVSSSNGSTFATVNARLRYIGDHVMLYTDTLDAGYNIQQLQSLMSLFDTHLWSEAVNAFGSDPDVDGNGRVIVLFTPVVNALSPAADCIQRGYVTGFFYPLDQLERAPRSNRGEIFYALIPDPAARYSCAHTDAEAVRIVQGAFLHEMQHLISFNEHVLARGGATEETWLNEGLSHMAEELGSRFFEMRYPAPFGRSSSAQLFPDSAAPFIGPLLLNAYLYLNSPLQHSVTSYAGTGSIEERGASWLFLRWLADQKGDGLLRRLVQTTRTGVSNVEAAAGERFAALFGDFSLALFADSLPGIARQQIPPRLRYANRSIRLLMARQAVVAGFSNPFPLTAYLTAPPGALRGGMLAGTMVHAIIPGNSAGAPVRLSFATPELAPFRSALSAQVGILRLPP